MPRNGERNRQSSLGRILNELPWQGRASHALLTIGSPSLESVSPSGVCSLSRLFGPLFVRPSVAIALGNGTVLRFIGPSASFTVATRLLACPGNVQDIIVQLQLSDDKEDAKWPKPLRLQPKSLQLTASCG